MLWGCKIIRLLGFSNKIPFSFYLGHSGRSYSSNRYSFCGKRPLAIAGMNAELPPFKNGEQNSKSVSTIDRDITPLNLSEAQLVSQNHYNGIEWCETSHLLNYNYPYHVLGFTEKIMVCMNACKNKNLFRPHRNLNPGPPVKSLMLYHLSYPGHHSWMNFIQNNVTSQHSI